ncbi:hypothetical protein ACIP98_31805 [Streptomyces sp. NPDC088354]|uniref:hypothetical protein n=1 Tax=unclassified Streptomyces TaxID=2593676 RepID=UPI0029B3D6AD|nr:hypothetical protein [Streptomyces sp. MI02-7b]MDX3076658.1 hypothetical protein [Streptomyces sp. MI02-7b]
MAATTDDSTPRPTGGGIALAALLLWLASYLRVNVPIDKRLRAAAASRTVPADTRQLQQRRDSVIWSRALLQTTALNGLLALLSS